MKDSSKLDMFTTVTNMTRRKDIGVYSVEKMF